MIRVFFFFVFVAVLTIVVIGGVLEYLFRDASGSGARMKQALIARIESAEGVFVEEHSNGWDAVGVASGIDLNETIIYDRLEVTDKQRAELLAALRKIDVRSRTRSGFIRACGHAPHHTLETVDQLGRKHRFSICFLCDTIEGPNEMRQGPFEAIEVFRTFIADIGMTPDGDWSARLAAHSLGESATGNLPKASLKE